jgi:hypothetical protein
VPDDNVIIYYVVVELSNCEIGVSSNDVILMTINNSYYLTLADLIIIIIITVTNCCSYATSYFHTTWIFLLLH